ncbi:MAG: glycosyltransferase, partial [Bacteroidota bacterium]|nr:glycosyltransferase [Bacteroidota bacterium]
MKISGFTYLRNAFTYGYPFIPSILSLLPLVDEFVIVVGDSDDGTLEAVENLKNEKIKIIRTTWNDSLRKGGKIFAQQSNIGIDHVTGDWAFHIQIDEVFHENDLQKIKEAFNKADKDPSIEALLFPFFHFFGDFNHIRNTRRTHRYEIRAFRTNLFVRSYNDSQGFRKYPSIEAYEQGD